MEKVEIKHFKVLQLPISCESNSIYYVLDSVRKKVKTYITDSSGIPIPLIDLAGEGMIESVTGTAVNGTTTNPTINISTFLSTELGNLVKLSSVDGKLKVNKITSPDLSLEVVSTPTELHIELANSLLEKINNALQPEDISQYTNEDAQDAIGNILVDTTTIDLVYNDITPSISVSVKPNSITTSELSTGVNTTLNLANSAVQPINIQNFFNKLVDDTDDIAEGTIKKFTTTAEKNFWNSKQENLVSGTNIKTIEGQSILGSGNIDLTKSDVGLSNVDNTSDLNKPTPTATQTALDNKVDKNTNIVAGTNTKITYDAKGLVTSGTSLLASDIPNIAQSQVTNLVADLAVKQNNLGFTPENSANKNVTNGYAGLGTDGKLISSQLPSLTISDTFVVNSQASMLGLTLAEKGDIAVRTDLNKTFILKGNLYSTLTDWQELLSPTSEVTSVFSRTGAVTAQAGDYTADQINETVTKVFQTPTQRVNNDATSSIQTQLNSKATGTGTANGTNTGDNATNTQYSSLVSNATHSGDVTGATVLTLANVNANVGSFGSASSVPQYTVNAKGLTTASTNVPIQITQSQVTNLGTDLASKVTTVGTTGNIQRIVGSNQLGNSALVDNGTSITSSLPFLSTGSITGNLFVKASAGTTNILLAGGADITQLSLPISSATQTAFNLKADLASPTFTGTPNLPTGTIAVTQTAGNSTTAPATTAFVGNAITTSDAGNVKTTGAQTISGIKSFSNPNSASIQVTTNNGNGVLINATTGIGLQATSSGNFSAANFTGQAGGNTLTITNQSGGTGAGLVISNTGTGVNIASSGGGTNTFTVDKIGATTATSFINSTAPAGNVLLAGGGTLANPITGTGTTNFLPKFTGAGTVGNSIVSDDGTTVMINKTGNASLNIMTNTIGNPSLFLTAGGSDGASIIYDRATSELRITNSGATNALRINSAGAATFSSTVTASNGTALNHLITKSQTLYTNQTITENKTVAITEFLNNNELILRVDATSGNITVTLPTFTALQGYKITVRKIDSSANSVLIQSVGGVNIDGASTLTVSGQYGKATVGADLVQYIIL